MTKKERVLAVMKKEQVDMIPAGFWFHYKSDYTVQQMIDEHMKLFRTTDMDIIKIMQDYPYPISGKITCADDWYHIQVKGTDSEEFAKMAEIIRGIRKEAGKDVLIFQTMFGPFKAASMIFGDDVLMKYSKEAPEAVVAGVKIIADALEEWTKGYLEAGADGMVDMINAGKTHDWMASTIDNNVTTDLYNVVQGFWANKDVDAVMKDMDVSIEISSAQ